ncbi:PilZ domain-containing protein [Sinobaca sp. H24]|uniref:PilZ domain-containing protein n=1 Tax=Sinobaca sp. H24 TaxID=2923376 RepID=UPI002079280C|nr:PilZ domain-containing protein [Sinobaca sp. H24]
MSNQRRDVRFNFESHPIEGMFSIYKMQEEIIESKPARMYLQDLSAGGLRFSSRLDIPPAAGVTYCFTFQVLQTSFQLYGTIQRKQKEGNRYYYGVKLVHSDRQMRLKIIQIVNRLAINRRKRERLIKGR